MMCSVYKLNKQGDNAGYIMWNARLDDSQARIKISGTNINNFRYTDETTLVAESEKELKSLL